MRGDTTIIEDIQFTPLRDGDATALLIRWPDGFTSFTMVSPTIIDDPPAALELARELRASYFAKKRARGSSLAD